MSQILPRYQILYRKAAQLQQKKAKLKYQQQISKQALDQLHPFQPSSRSKHKLNFQSFIKRNTIWTRSSKSKRMLRSMNKQKMEQEQIQKNCLFSPQIHPSPSKSLKRQKSIKGSRNHYIRKLKAKIKDEEKRFLLNNPASYIWNSSKRYDSQFQELNLQLKINPKPTPPTTTRKQQQQPQIHKQQLQEHVQIILQSIFTQEQLKQLQVQ